MYTALPLKLAIEKLTTEFQSNIKELETNISKKSFTDDRVWSLKMQSSIRVQSKELIESAQESIRISAWNDTLLEYLPLLEQKQNKVFKLNPLLLEK